MVHRNLSRNKVARVDGIFCKKNSSDFSASQNNTLRHKSAKLYRKSEAHPQLTTYFWFVRHGFAHDRPHWFCTAAILLLRPRKVKTMKGRAGFLVLTAIILSTSSASDAQAQRNCAPRETVLERLAQRYGETRQSVGLGRDNSMVEVFASLQSGSWTITVTTPTGLTCLIASGQSFEPLEEPLPNYDNDA